jgi:hypothetical protein
VSDYFYLALDLTDVLVGKLLIGALRAILLRAKKARGCQNPIFTLVMHAVTSCILWEQEELYIHKNGPEKCVFCASFDI